MKTSRIVASASLAAVFLLAGFFVGGGVLSANAAPSTNASADVVVGQQNMTSYDYNQDGNVNATDANKLYYPRCPFFDGKKFFVADMSNNRVLIYNSIPTSNDVSADVVIGQQNMGSNGYNQGGSVSANALSQPSGVFSDGTRLFIADSGNNRVLIYNSIPTSNDVSADVVIGQQNMTSGGENQGSVTAGANTLSIPSTIFFDGKRIFIGDWGNNRVLIFNSIPTANGASADVVIGQLDMTSNDENQGGSVSASTLSVPNGVYANGKKMFVADQGNNRVLIYNSIPTSSNASADVVIGQPDMTSNSANQGGSADVNKLSGPTHIFPYGPKLLVADSSNNRVLVYNSIPTTNNANADVVIGQANMSGSDYDQGGSVSAAGMDWPRGIFVANSKLMIGDYYNQRVLIYNSFGAQWAIAKNHSQTLTGGEKIKVKKSKLEFSGKKTEYKKGQVRIVVDGVSKKVVKIGNSGKWSAKFTYKGSAVKNVVIRYYNSHRNLQLNSETYALGIRTGVSALTFEKATLSSGSLFEKPEEKATPVKTENLEMPARDARGI